MESKKAVNACFVAGSEEFCREDEGGKKEFDGRGVVDRGEEFVG